MAGRIPAGVSGRPSSGWGLPARSPAECIRAGLFRMNGMGIRVGLADGPPMVLRHTGNTGWGRLAGGGRGLTIRAHPTARFNKRRVFYSRKIQDCLLSSKGLCWTLSGESEQRVKELAARINQAPGELAEKYPDEGFVIVGLTSVGADTGVTAVFNVDEEDLPEIPGGSASARLKGCLPRDPS